MNPDDLARLLDELGQRLGPTGEYVFSLAIRQVYINAAVAAFLLVLALVPLLFVPRFIRWVQGNGAYGSRDLLGVLLGVCYAVVLVLVALLAIFYIPAVLNPEYAALRSLLGAVR